MNDHSRPSPHRRTSRKHETGQQQHQQRQAGLAVRSRESTSNNDTGTGSDTGTPHTPGTIAEVGRRRGQEYVNNEFEGHSQQTHRELKPVRQTQHGQQFADQIGGGLQPSDGRAGVGTSVITNLTANPEHSPTSSRIITNLVRAQDQPFPASNTSNRRPDNNYQILPFHNHYPLTTTGSAATNDAMYATPYSGIPYIQTTFPDQETALPAPGMTRYNNNNNNNNTDRSMEILSATQYDDGAAMAVARGSRSATIASHNSQKQRHSQPDSQPPVFGLTGRFEHSENPQGKGRSRTQTSRTDSSEMTGGERRRKKQKLSDDEEEQDESQKKSRGRPRLDTKDETAADRRRTQIRMAQRAYRNRKETTIASLEKQVQDLRGTNEEMNSIFINLYDFAVGKGLLQREPEFGQHLQSSTQRFLALAKSITSDEQSKEDDSAGGESGFQGQYDVDADSMPQLQHERQLSQAESQPIVQAWGYQIEEGAYSEPTQADQLQFNTEAMTMPNRQQQHQIISRATTDNASFSFDMLDDLQQYRAEVPDLADNSELFLNFQDTSLPGPTSFAYQETSFARVLQRAAIEGGYALITHPNPHPSRFNEVFGFCLRFSSKEQIKNRLHALVFSNSKDPLYAWREPFVHVGGSGTFYPIHDQGISGDLQPKVRTGMSMGPFSSSVTEAKENDFCDEFHTNVPGFEGEFFDSNDVEGYLRGRGIEIAPDANYVTLDLDIISIFNVPSLPSTDTRSRNSASPPVTPHSPETRFSELIDQNNANSDLPTTAFDDFTNSDTFNNGSDLDFNIPMDWANLVDPFTTSVQGRGNDKAATNTNNATVNPFDLDGPIFNSVPQLQHTLSSNSASSEPPKSRGRARHVTVAVSVLVEELLRRAVCLGRAPGFRLADVDAAIKRAIQASL